MPYLLLSQDVFFDTPIDIAPDCEELNWSENDLDAPNSGRALDGKMYRGKVTSKHRCDIKLWPVNADRVNEIFPVLRNEYFYCRTDLVPGSGPLTMEMYNSTRKGGVLIVTTEGEIKHKDVAFNIIER